jgi:D-alanyl-D-alanine carboxypeptidase/D-alanyl-D-alanine-endopeptidase (penicillin-binding protein 4)
MHLPNALALGLSGLLMALPGCASRSAATVTAAPVVSLSDALQSLFTDPALDHASWGVQVRSLATGDILYSLNPSRHLVPASNQKLLTVAAAVETLGWDYRFTTRVLAAGKVGEDGALDGDLIVVGSGDPTINPRHPERWAALDNWAGQIAAKGVRIVGGNLIGDDDAFAEPGWGSGWSWEDLATGYGSPIGALQYHENQVEITVGPGLEPGTRAIISTAPLGSGLLIDHDVATVATGEPTRLSLERVPGWTILTVRGQIAAGDHPRTLYAAVENPTQLFVNAFREALARKGIFVAGNAVDIDSLRSKPDLAHADTWVTDQSEPLSAIVDPLLKWSRNGYAETLLWALSPIGEPANEAVGLKVMREALTRLGIAPDLYGAYDGSGLSRYDTVSAEALTTLLARTWSDPLFKDRYKSALPVAATSGSLETRMKDTPAAGRVWAKTGSMFNIRTLSGYVMTADDEPVVFSFLANNYRVPSADIDAVMDKALARLAEFRRGAMNVGLR